MYCQVKRIHFFYFLVAFVVCLLFTTNTLLPSNIYGIKLFNSTLNSSSYFYNKFFKNFIVTKVTEKYVNVDLIKNTKKIVSINGPTAGGYGNQLYSMLSSLTVAKLTDGKFICLWPNINEYIEEPFESSFKNNNFDINKLANKTDIHVLGLTDGWTIKKNIKAIIKTKFPTEYSFFYYADIQAHFFELCTNPIYYERLLGHKLVTAKTINEAKQVLADKNSSSDELHDKLFQIGFEVGGNLLRRHWIPKKYILDKINELYSKHFKNNFVIGMQIRTHYLNTNKDVRVFVDCAFDIENNYLKANNGSGLTKLIKWYLSSDSDQVIESLAKSYPNKTIFGEGMIAHVVSNKKGYFRTIIDNELLSMTNELIITGK